jgi:GNAT superfamily N-acetyltransferase
MDANGYFFRPLEVRDAQLIGEHRCRMFEEADMPYSATVPLFREWLDKAFAAGNYTGWIAEYAGEPVAGAGMMFLDWPPHPRHPENNRRGYILNVFVEPAHRRRGIAAKLMELCYEQARGLRITYLVLHASEQGRPLYERDGWKATNEMSFDLTRVRNELHA